jgi:hypothetical protein
MKRESDPAQGVLLGCLIGACLWLIVGLVWWVL